MIPILETARFAVAHHHPQVRKYSDEPYVLHSINVALRLYPRILPIYPYLDVRHALQAAVLHDVLEDTDTEYEDLVLAFGHRVASLVLEVTDQFTDPALGNRAKRKALERDRLARASPLAQCIKLADLEDNSASILEHDPEFAKTYLREKQALLEVLTKTPEAWRLEVASFTRIEIGRAELEIALSRGSRAKKPAR